MPEKCPDCGEEIYSMQEIIDELDAMPKEIQELFSSPKPVLPHWTWEDSKSDWRKDNVKEVL